MRIRLTNERLLADLLAFMRASGCIAYYEPEDSIEVLLPNVFGAKEVAEIGALLTRWLSEHPEAEPEVLA